MSFKIAAAILFIVTLILVVYSPLFNAGFVWDDKAVYENPVMSRTDGLAQIWFHPGKLVPYEIHYWPVVHSTFWLEHLIHGDRAAGYHITNVVLHILNCLLLWGLLRKISVPGAWFTAVIFGVHPVHVESVAWIVERKDLLSFLFYLLAFQLYLAYRKSARKPFMAGALFCFILALFSKSIAITFPILLLFWEWSRNDQPIWRIRRDHLPFWAAAAGYAILDISLARTAEVLTFSFSFPEKILIAGRSLWFYIRQLFYPVEILAVHPRWPIDAGDIIQYIFPVSAAAVIAVIAARRRQWGRGPIFTAAMFCFTLMPVLGFISFGFMRYSFVADRFQYLASVFPITGVSALTAGFARRRDPATRQVVSFAAAVIIIVFAALTYQHAGHYHDKLTLFQHTLSRNPDAYIAHYNVAAEAALAGDHERAIQHYREVQRIHPGHGDTQLQLANSLMALGRYRAAEIEYQGYLEGHPGKVNAYINLGNVQLRQNRMTDAIQSYQRALTLDPENSMANNNLGFCMAQSGRTVEALECYATALKRNPQSIETHLNIARILMKKEDWRGARRHYEKVVSLSPESTEALNNLAWLLATGSEPEPEAAVKLARKACAVTDWQQPELMDTLITACLAAGLDQEAAETADKAIKAAERNGNADMADALRKRVSDMAVDNRSNM